MKRRVVCFLIIALTLIGGFFYRSYLASSNDTQIYYDMASYDRMAKDIVGGQFGADCCDHNAGYSLFLAGIYKVFGENNTTAFQTIQIFLDLLSGVLIYFSAKELFSKRAAIFSYIFYIINPFTSSYTGLRLAETFSIFLVAVIAFVITRKNFTIKPFYWIIIGLLLGYFLFTRVSASLSVYLFIGSLFLFVLKGKRKIAFLILCFIGFFITSLYSLGAYYHYFHKISLTPPYPGAGAAFYWNFYNDRYPELLSEYNTVNPTFYQLNLEAHTTYFPDKPQYVKKYQALFSQRIKTDWPLFIHNTVRNMYWMWDKNHLAYYIDPFYPSDVWVLRITNIFFLLLFFIGLLSYIFQKKNIHIFAPIVLWTLILFGCITFIFTLFSNETRHSIYFYSLVFLWAGNGIDGMIQEFSRKKIIKHTQ